MKLRTFGSYGSVREIGTGNWHWKIQSKGKVMLEGIERTKAAADKALEANLGAALMPEIIRADNRSYLRMKLRSWIDKRPHLADYVFDVLETGPYFDVSTFVVEAADRERSYHDDTHPALRRPIPTHHLSLSAGDVAKTIADLMVKLEYAKPLHEDDPNRIAITGSGRAWLRKSRGSWPEGFEKRLKASLDAIAVKKGLMPDPKKAAPAKKAAQT